MEYMLLPDGSVKCYDYALTREDAVEQLELHAGIAYYWHTLKGWGEIILDARTGSKAYLPCPNVPAIIKLTAMLE